MLLRLTKSLPQDQWGLLSNIESDGDVIFGIFENAYGENAYMITNAGSTTEIPGKDYLANFEINDANVCLQFNVENCHYLKVISGGESEYVKQSADGTFQFTIPDRKMKTFDCLKISTAIIDEECECQGNWEKRIS